MKKIKLLTVIAICLAGAAVCFVACEEESHEHTYEAEWTRTETKHYYAATCEHTDERKDEGTHEYDGESDTTCNVCGYERAVEPPHTHTYATEWTRTETKHYYAATCEHMDERKDEGAHEYDDESDTTCNVCGYERTVALPHAHVWSAWSVTEANKPTAGQAGKATRTCSGEGVCNASAEDKEHALPTLDSADYQIQNDTATCTATGSATYVYYKDGMSVSFNASSPVNPAAHSWGDYRHDDDPNGHYKTCLHNSEHTTQKEAHDTEGANGVCSVCGYNKVEMVSATSQSEQISKTVKAGKSLHINFTGMQAGYYVFTYTGAGSIRVSWSCGHDGGDEEVIQNGEDFTVKISEANAVAVVLIAGEGQTDYAVTLSLRYSEENPDEGWSDFH